MYKVDRWKIYIKIEENISDSKNKVYTRGTNKREMKNFLKDKFIIASKDNKYLGI